RAQAVDPNRHISQYGHTTWRSRDGTVPGSAGIAQTADGYIWMIGAKRLLRFDGIQFVTWEPPKGTAFPGNFLSILGASDGSLWLGTRAGLARIKDGQLSTVSSPNDQSGISEIIEDHAGRIWLTRYGGLAGRGTLCEVVGNGLRCYGHSDGLP